MPNFMGHYIMKKLAFFRIFLLLILISRGLVSQDIVYTSTGNKIKAKVTEINLTDIKYKDFSNLNGPTYVIPKSDVVLIEYQNGYRDIINANPKDYAPAKIKEPSPEAKEKPNLHSFNKNLISINALSLANGDLAVMYDREFANHHLNVSLLGAYNFNSRMGFLNYYVADSKDFAKKNFDLGVGLNFIPSNIKSVQYFLGVFVKYMNYSYKEQVNTNNNQIKYVAANGSQTAFMFNNGWIVRIAPTFNFKFFFAFGVPQYSPSIGEKHKNGVKFYIGYCFGYKF